MECSRGLEMEQGSPGWASLTSRVRSLSFLCLVPEEAKTSAFLEETGYDTYYVHVLMDWWSQGFSSMLSLAIGVGLMHSAL